jgi:hypothetical protein
MEVAHQFSLPRKRLLCKIDTRLQTETQIEFLPHSAIFLRESWFNKPSKCLDDPNQQCHHWVAGRSITMKTQSDYGS